MSALLRVNEGHGQSKGKKERGPGVDARRALIGALDSTQKDPFNARFCVKVEPLESAVESNLAPTLVAAQVRYRTTTSAFASIALWAVAVTNSLASAPGSFFRTT